MSPPTFEAEHEFIPASLCCCMPHLLLLPNVPWLYRQVSAPAQVHSEVNKSVSRPRKSGGSTLLDDMHIKVLQFSEPN